MKKIVYSLGILAAAAIAFSSCQKEQATNEVLTPSEELVTITFNAEKAGIDTKTAAVEGETSVSYEWTDSDVDHMRLFVVSEDKDGKEVLTSVSNITVNKVSGTKLTIAAQVAPNATYTFRAVLAGSWTNDGTKPRVNNTQYPSLSNYDSAADVLVSDDKEVTVGASEQATIPTEAMELSFRRLVVVNKMTLKNLTKGEVIDKIVITSTQNLTGYYDTNAKTAIGSGKVLTLNYNSSAPVTNDNGQFPVFFTAIPQTGHVLTVEVTTDQFIYTKTFAAGKSIDFNLGQFTKFNFALPAGVANTALALPVEDEMTWGMTGGSDATAAMSAADLTAVQGTKKIYDSSSYAYKGSDGIKLGNSGNNGYIKTNSINLSSDFYIAIDARAYKESDNPTLEISVDDNLVYTSAPLLADFNTYYVNCSAATAASSVTITSNSRSYIKNLVIASGTYAVPPVIKVTSSNPLEVANTGGAQTIAYSIDNPTSGVSLTASTEATWIKNLSYATSGSVTFDVDSQETAAAAREATITLAYTGAKSVNVTVSQAAGAGAAIDYSKIETSNVTLTAGTNGSAATVNGKDAIKVGSSKAGGNMTVTVPAGTTKLHLHAAAWNGVTGLSLNISGATVSPASIALTADSGISDNSPFTLAGNPADFYFVIELSNITADTDITFTSSSAKRFVVWGVNAEAGTPATPKVATPTISISGTEVSIACATDGATIWYSLNSANLEEYSAPIDISGSNEATIETYAVKTDYEDSDVAGEIYYAVNVNSTTNGSVTAVPFAAQYDEVSLTVTPDAGYALDQLSVVDENDDAVAVANNKFTMPASPVTVTASFVAGTVPSTPTLQYTLTPESGSNNSYTGNCDIEIDGITWNLTGNSQQIPWRIGGKSLSGVDRALYSKTALAKNISKIEITHGTASSITVNSMTVIVSKNADFSSPVSTLTPSFVANDTVTVDRPDGKDWSNCYYKIVYNVTVSGTSNKFVEFSEAKFYGTN